MKALDRTTYFILAFFTLTTIGCGQEKQGPQVEPIVNELKDDSAPALSASPAHSPSQQEQPLALIYKGPGSCSADQGDAGRSGYGCSEAAADAAVQAGFRYQFVGPNEQAHFDQAKVWIQPGGISNVAFYAMNPALRSALVQFVSNGGGYVGYCAGAFLATDWFGIFPGRSHLYRYSSARSDVGYAFLDFTWNGSKRSVYFEGGPYITNIGSQAEITATFSTGYVAAARSNYGKGRVYISGPHPEAPQIWSQEDGIPDPDGSDLDLAAQMITWAAGLE